MKRLLLLIAMVAAACGPATGASTTAPLSGARVVKACAAAGPFWPTMTLALGRAALWVACKEQSRVIRVDAGTGKVIKSVRLGGPAIAVASGFGAIWALDGSGTLYRLNPSSAKVVRRLALPVSAAYNIWIGGGSVWVADDQGAQVVRVSPVATRVAARIPVGDGPADMAFDGQTAWVINHRDRVLTEIDLATNRGKALAVVPGGAPERMVSLLGSLWITGRGTDLLKVTPADGSVETTVEIGGSGIDIVAEGDDLWIPTRTAAVDVRGFPRLDALKRVSASSATVSRVVRASGRVDVHGLAIRKGVLWIADNTKGVVYRLR